MTTGHPVSIKPEGSPDRRGNSIPSHDAFRNTCKQTNIGAISPAPQDEHHGRVCAHVGS